MSFEPQVYLALSPSHSATLCQSRYVVRANLIALNLSEGSPRIGDGTTGRRCTIHYWTVVGAV
jgi:hypothetical protein